FLAVHAVVHATLHDIIHFDLHMPMRHEHHWWMGVKHLKGRRQTLDAARSRLIDCPPYDLTFRQVHVPFLGDSGSLVDSLAAFAKGRKLKREDFQCASNSSVRPLQSHFLLPVLPLHSSRAI